MRACCVSASERALGGSFVDARYVCRVLSMRVSAAGLLLVMFALTGCTEAMEEKAAPVPSGDAAGVEEPAADLSTAAVPSAELCAFLESEVLPVSRQPGATAQVVIAISAFYTERDAVVDAEMLEAQSRQECPEVRSEILRALDADSFTNL
ncbi:hypothetical protein Acsp01_36680 [Actinoplanes sp. NBRC 101535]|nr:hypothetical protein Acsp01_36680 [Actinoplanes sp. NBRC 101535]